MLREEALKAGDIASYGTEDSLAQIESSLKVAGHDGRPRSTPSRSGARRPPVYEKLGYGELREQLQAALAK